MKIIPVAADSMGVRSMATFIEAGGIKILIDPGAALGPERFGLPPHPVEKWMLKKFIDRIKLYIRIADIVIITNYHPEHFYDISYEMYRGKKIFLKNPNSRIPAHQRNRAFGFINSAKKLSYQAVYADNGEVKIKDVVLKFSPSFYSNKEKTDSCVMLELEENEKKFLFSSCVNGFIDENSLTFAVNSKPDILYLDGPDVSSLNNAKQEAIVKARIKEIGMMVTETPVTSLIIDHHIKRSTEWADYITDISAIASGRNVEITSAALLRGEDEKLLEARRKFLYASDKNHQQKLF
ncbi:hypothetical protein J7K93_07330 [bacterium]|nr:hypothetical protein [bacterium]